MTTAPQSSARLCFLTFTGTIVIISLRPDIKKRKIFKFEFQKGDWIESIQDTKYSIKHNEIEKKPKLYTENS